MTTKPWDFSAFPPCAQPCMYNQAPLFCTFNDFKCQCTDDKYRSVWTTCVAGTCNQNEQKAAWGVNFKGCRTVGFNVRDLVPIGFAGSTGPGSDPLASDVPGSGGLQTTIVTSTAVPSASLSQLSTAAAPTPTSGPAADGLPGLPVNPFASTAPGQTAYTDPAAPKGQRPYTAAAPTQAASTDTAQKEPVSTPGPQTSSTSSSHHNGIAGGTIAGIVVGIFALFAIIGLIFFLLRRYRQQKDADSLDDHTWQPVSPMSANSPMPPGSRSGSNLEVGIGKPYLEVADMAAAEKPQVAYKENKKMPHRPPPMQMSPAPAPQVRRYNDGW